MPTLASPPRPAAAIRLRGTAKLSQPSSKQPGLPNRVETRPWLSEETAKALLQEIAAAVQAVPADPPREEQQIHAAIVYIGIREEIERLLPWIERRHPEIGLAIRLRMKIADRFCEVTPREPAGPGSGAPVTL